MRWIETAEQCDIGNGGVPGCKLELAQLVGYGAEVELIQFLDAAGTDAPLEPNHIGVGHISLRSMTCRQWPLIWRRQATRWQARSWGHSELNITRVHALDPDGVHIELMQFLNRD